MQAQQQQLINGVWMDGAAESLNKYDPVSGELLWQGGGQPYSGRECGESRTQRFS